MQVDNTVAFLNKEVILKVNVKPSHRCMFSFLLRSYFYIVPKFQQLKLSSSAQALKAHIFILQLNIES